jgi:Autotransporter beta-domain
MKKPACLTIAATLIGLAAANPVLAQGALGPPSQPTLSDAQKATAVNSNTQSQLNATVYFALPAIGAVIQQGLVGRTVPGQRSALTAPLGSEACEPVACAGTPWGWTGWVQGGGGQSTNSLAVGGYNLANYGTQAGVQAQITPTLLVGVGASWQGTNGTLNGGLSSTSSIWGITPYAGWQFDAHWNLSGIVGFSTGSSWLSTAGPPYGATYQNTQWTFQGGLNGNYSVGRFVVAPTVSLTHAPTTTYGYTDSAGSFIPGRATAMTRGSAGALVSLALDGWQPYVRASIDHDFTVPAGSEANGDTGGTVGAGATIPLTPSVWASVDGGYNSIGRAGLSLWAASARLNLRF